MRFCPKCGFKLDDVDRKQNACPVCGEVLDKRRKDKEGDPRRRMRKDERAKRPL
jgi:transcription initiation factor TFIIIB Brf1 subunit/transcription initiation factor TFIIB